MRWWGGGGNAAPTAQHPAAPVAVGPSHARPPALIEQALRAADDGAQRERQPPYRHRARAYHDLLTLSESFPHLQPMASPCPGWRQPLVCMSGTVPIVHAGVQYNIPVLLRLLPSYPEPARGASGVAAPVEALVTPTAEMVIKPAHAHVDASGRCVLHALAHWSPRDSTLVGVVSELCAEFSADPPVFARPAGARQPPAAQPTPVAQAYLAPAHGAPTSTAAATAAAGAAAAGASGTAHPAARDRPQSQPPPSTLARANTGELLEEMAGQRRAFIAEQARRRGARLAAEHAERVRALHAERQALQQRAAAIVALDGECARVRAAAESAALAVSEARARAEEWGATYAGGADPAAPSRVRIEPPPSLDALVLPADGRSAQLLELLAEERALRESVQMLASQLEAGRVPPAAFVRHTRRLSRELFFARAARIELLARGSA